MLGRVVEGLERSAELPDYAIYQASPDGATSQAELFELATRFHSSESTRPIHMPRLLAAPGVVLPAPVSAAATGRGPRTVEAA